MLSKPYLEIKRLRSNGKAAAALALLRSTLPASDDDAFEAAICLFACGDTGSAVHVCQSRAWQAPWARQIAEALIAFLRDGDAARALPPARLAVSGHTAAYDAQAVFLILLQANGLIDEADAYMQGHLANPPAGETLLLTIMAEIAAAVADWPQAYRLASTVIAADPDDFRALITLSIVNHGVNNPHEALGQALRARLIYPQSPLAILQVMRGFNSLGDYYGAIGAFDALAGADGIAPDLYVELGIAYAGLDLKADAISALHTALRTGPPPAAALLTLITIHTDANESAQVEALVQAYPGLIQDDTRCLIALGFERLKQGDLGGAAQRIEASFALARQQNLAVNDLPWPVPEPRLRHDYEQLELLARRGKLDAAARGALAVLQRYHDPSADAQRTVAPAEPDAAALQHALTALHYRPAGGFEGRALGGNDYPAIENNYFAGQPALVVIDNFLAPQALAALREYCEEATVWRVNNPRGYVGAMIDRGFCSGVLLAIAHQLKQAMPRVIGDHALMQAWGFKYDQRLQGIHLHADFAKVNVNFWITPDQACEDHTSGGLIIYDTPAPKSWTFADYNTNQSKMTAYLKVHNAKSTRVPYRENRCVLFDSSLIHVTDELHFKPGYENRRVNVTLLYGRARSQG